MESHQKHRTDLHFKSILAQFLSASCMPPFSLQLDSLCSWTTPGTVAASELSPTTQSLSLNLSVCLVVEEGWPRMVRQVPPCARAPEQ